MNKKKRLSDNDAEKIMKYIGSLYRQTSLRADLAEHDQPGHPLTNQCLNDRSFVYLIDRSLQNCSKETQWIIRKQYLEISDTDWFLEFFTRSRFIRICKKAIREFLGILDLARN